jgi:chaperonin GroEL (HSP60 family)
LFIHYYYSSTQVKDALRDGLRAAKNAYDDEAVLPGAGAFEVAISNKLSEEAKNVKGKNAAGVQVGCCIICECEKNDLMLKNLLYVG